MTSQTSTTAAELSDAAAEAIRQLNHLTRQTGSGLEYPGDAYSTVANLSTLAMRLPQSLVQILAFMDRLGHEGHLRSDNGPGDLATRLEDLREGIAAAQRCAEALHVCLNRAHNALSPIGYAE
ncbi:hypothetical protein SAZ11_29310 [Streptomyces sp. FXJ1.4098]|nr:hypothetical protein [Streptomyces sp. FXJ1.4098]MDW6061369.1 hypothetical protein [Streptomyces sp. FXJ1.4098]